MNTKEIIEKIKLTFSELVNVTEKQKFMDATLQDGSTIQMTEMAVGGIVTINGTPAPAGEYTLQDMSVLVVGDNGAITEVKPAQNPAVPEEPPMQEDMGAKFSAFESSTNEKFAAYENKFAAYEQRFADYENKLNLATKVINDLIQLTQKISETPTGVPDESVKSSNNFHSEKKEKRFNYDLLFSK